MTQDQNAEAITFTLGDKLPEEMARVRDHLIPIYLSINPPGTFALARMRKALDDAAKAVAEGDTLAAAKAMAEGDTFAMLGAYSALKDFKV